MTTIENRADISFLVHTFYAEIRKDALLGPIFNSHISENQWPEHLEKLTDFWETNLFGIPKFKGNPTQKHLGVDRNLHHKTSQVHFGQWLNLWFQTIDAHFEGVTATKAKEAARRMAHGQFMAIYNHRP
ncbi:group III truncated hemoglobin [Winogradskyella jejuensis]|uniref:Hemoglobin n=1 Tax=Winogradskyella jejuensis TaxID=1089305 RepID=A0A1M5KRD5_9FLAO|nr:group III truncated hemoglobin [Winogradskyella jejuensis]SHG55364.1 hemoglobin [Winogradskyella jejuensis]